MQEEEDCELLRAVSATRCVIRLTQTGSTVLVTLRAGLDMARARMVSPLHPVQAQVTLGPFDGDKFTNCSLDVAWQDTVWVGPFPARQKLKRR